MRSIKAQWPSLTELSFSYKTAEEAVAGTLGTERSQRAAREREVRPLEGNLVSCRWTDTELHLNLDLGQVLLLFIQDGRVEWEWRDSSAAVKQQSVEDSEESILIVLVNTTREWNRRDVVEYFCGAGCIGVVPGHVWLRVAFDGRCPLWLWVLEDQATRQPLLYWFIDQDDGFWRRKNPISRRDDMAR